MTCKEKWTLPVVYVPRFPWNEAKNLLDVLYEVVDVGDVTVVFFWFHWSHDLPASKNPEYEPLAIAFHHGWPKMVFYRPHNRHACNLPVLYGRRAVVYVSLVGHAPKVSRLSILWRSLTPFLYKRIGRKTFEKLLRQGQPPNDFIVWKNVNFRDWVVEQLRRPEISKCIQDDRHNGLLRYTWYMLKAAHHAGEGDLDKLFKNLLKAFHSMPSVLKTSHLGSYILKAARGVKEMINNGEKLEEAERVYVKEKIQALLLETFIDIVEVLTLKNEERKQYAEEIATIMTDIKNT